MREFLHQGYWFLRSEPWIVWAVAILIVIALIMAKGESLARERLAQYKEEFYYECLKDHKRYECDVLWQQFLPQRKQRARIYMTTEGNMVIPL